MTFALGDKVMQLENDYEREVYNGDLGRIIAIDHARSEVQVEIDARPLTYAFSELDRLVPAYAITVHKAQGSEYPAVVLPLARQHGRMLRRNLVYTAVTRAKRLVVLVVEGDALELAIAGRPEPRRWSRLRALLQAGQDEPARRHEGHRHDRPARASPPCRLRHRARGRPARARLFLPARVAGDRVQGPAGRGERRRSRGRGRDPRPSDPFAFPTTT